MYKVILFFIISFSTAFADVCPLGQEPLHHSFYKPESIKLLAQRGQLSFVVKKDIEKVVFAGPNSSSLLKVKTYPEAAYKVSVLGSIGQMNPDPDGYNFSKGHVIKVSGFDPSKGFRTRSHPLLSYFNVQIGSGEEFKADLALSNIFSKHSAITRSMYLWFSEFFELCGPAPQGANTLTENVQDGARVPKDDTSSPLRLDGSNHSQALGQ